MKNVQLEFNFIEFMENDLYICDTCLKCKNKCNVYSISKNANLICRNFKKVDK